MIRAFPPPSPSLSMPVSPGVVGKQGMAAQPGADRPEVMFSRLLAGQTSPSATSAGISPTTLLSDGIGQVNAMQRQADAMVQTKLAGGDVNEAEVLTAVQKADLAFRMMLQIRNKLMEAYREVQQIQI